MTVTVTETEIEPQYDTGIVPIGTEAYGGIPRVDHVGQIDTERLVEVQLAGDVDETLGEGGMDAPVAHRIGVG